jgi:hypothetical protein
MDFSRWARPLSFLPRAKLVLPSWSCVRAVCQRAVGGVLGQERLEEPQGVAEDF